MKSSSPSAEEATTPVTSPRSEVSSASHTAAAVAMANAAIDNARRAAAASSPGGRIFSSRPPPSDVPLTPNPNPIPGTAEFVKNDPLAVRTIGGSGGGVGGGGRMAAVAAKNAQQGGIVGSGSSVSASTPGSDLDLKHNDNAFHVVASLVTDRVLPKVQSSGAGAGATSSYELDESDRAFFDQMLPMSVRRSFVNALRFRLRVMPTEKTLRDTPLMKLTLQCQRLGLDKEDSANVLLTGGSGSATTVQSSLPPLGDSVASRARAPPVLKGYIHEAGGSNNNYEPPQSLLPPLDGSPSYQTHMLEEKERELQQRESALKEQQLSFQQERIEKKEEELRLQQDRIVRMQQQQQQQGQQQQPTSSLMQDSSPRGYDPPALTTYPLNSLAISSSTLSDANAATSESLARQQIMAELKEATALMNDSVTPEAAAFWRNHVSELQLRLSALNGKGGGGNAIGQSHSSGLSPVTSDYHSADDGKNKVGLAQKQEKIRAYYGGREYFQTQEEYLEANRQMRAKYHAQQLGRSDMGVHAIVSDAAVVPAPSGDKAIEAREVPGTNAASKAGLPMVEVIAPSDLPEGYMFEAQIGSKRFLATVPPGGIRKGDKFTSPMRKLEMIEIEAPIGEWRDDLCDCLSNDICHPLVMNTLFCLPVALGQIMTRTGLSWFGVPARKQEYKSSFTNMVCIFLFWIAMNGLAVFLFRIKWQRGVDPSNTEVSSFVLFNALMLIYIIFAVKNTRASVRSKYQIPEERCLGYEDAVCATCCTLCTVCQMGRHTADFDTYRGVCCTETGLPRHVRLGAVRFPQPSTQPDEYPHIV